LLQQAKAEMHETGPLSELDRQIYETQNPAGTISRGEDKCKATLTLLIYLLFWIYGK